MRSYCPCTGIKIKTLSENLSSLNDMVLVWVTARQQDVWICWVSYIDKATFNCCSQQIRDWRFISWGSLLHRDKHRTYPNKYHRPHCTSHGALLVWTQIYIFLKGRKEANDGFLYFHPHPLFPFEMKQTQIFVKLSGCSINPAKMLCFLEWAVPPCVSKWCFGLILGKRVFFRDC